MLLPLLVLVAMGLVMFAIGAMNVPQAVRVENQEIIMRIIDVALKDLSQILRDRRSLLFLVAMPILFTLFMGFAYKSGDTKGCFKG